MSHPYVESARAVYLAARAAGDDAAALTAADQLLALVQLTTDLDELETLEEALEVQETVMGDAEALGCALDAFTRAALRIGSQETTPDAVRLGVCRRAYHAWQRTEGRTWRA